MFNKHFGEEIGKMLQAEHEQNGVKVHNNVKVQEIHGTEGNVSSITLSDGTTLEADFVLLGTGVTPRTSFLKDSGIELA